MASPPTNPVVLHLKRSYLPLSETFVYEVLKNHRRYRPRMLAWRTENLGNFPLEGLVSLGPRGPLGSWIDRIGLRLNCRLPATERAMIRAARPLAPRILHAHFGTQGWHALPLRRRLGVPLVTTFYGGDLFARASDPGWLAAYRRLFREGDLFLVEGEHMAGVLTSFGCPAGKVAVQPIGIDADRFDREPPPPPRSGEPVRVLMCGRFVEKKGFEDGLRAFAIARREHPDLELRIVGDGERRPALERLQAELGLGRSAILLGLLPHEEYRREALSAHLFMAPSVLAANGDSEGGAPTVLLEMQALQLPVLATRHADIPNVVRDGQSGILVPERAPEALGRALLELSKNPARWREMGAMGRAFIRERHDSRKLAGLLEGRYDERIAAAESAAAGQRMLTPGGTAAGTG
jgi:colanic acid/amylovoran biosynthesis glycosyltransferase